MTEMNAMVHREEQKKGPKRGLLIWGSVAAIGALITAAAFVDAEWATVHPESGYAVGTHNLQLKHGDDDWGDHPTADSALEVEMVADHTPLVPGLSTVAGDYMVRNASEDYGSTLTLTMVDGSGPSGSKALRDALRFTVTVGDETLPNYTYAQLKSGVELQKLGPEDERAVAVTAKVASDIEDLDAIQGQQAQLHLRLDGTAVAPEAS